MFSNFTPSTVLCIEGSCDKSVFKGSAVKCKDIGNCVYASFDSCSCCVGSSCSSLEGDVVSCEADPISFCTTCAESGNPFCRGYAPVPSVGTTPSPTDPPALPVSTPEPPTAPVLTPELPAVPVSTPEPPTAPVAIAEPPTAPVLTSTATKTSSSRYLTVLAVLALVSCAKI